MPDTVYYTNNGKATTLDSLPADIKAILSKDISLQQQKQTSDSGHAAAMCFFAIVFIAIVLKLLFQSGDTGQKDNTADPESKPGDEDQNAEPGTLPYYVYDGATLGMAYEEITAILAKRYPFYNHLNPDLQRRFANRLMHFMGSKRFVIYSQEPFKEMPVLTSAAAIHLTFGLDEYLLPWFTHICIHPQEYFAHDSLRVLAGNVEGNTITFAWNQLLDGIAGEDDGVNVGLHEMAHALYYQHAEVQGERTGKFAAHFEEVMEEGAEVYQLKTAQKLLFTDYAYRNLQEFWAESVEIFFEKPAEMKHCHSKIYDTLVELLQQNPMNKENPLGLD